MEVDVGATGPDNPSAPPLLHEGNDGEIPGHPRRRGGYRCPFRKGIASRQRSESGQAPNDGAVTEQPTAVFAALDVAGQLLFGQRDDHIGSFTDDHARCRRNLDLYALNRTGFVGGPIR